jgi:guanyl-specific ribonuclease Sa
MRKGGVTAEEILQGVKGRLDDIGRTLNGGIEAAYAGVPSGWRGKPTNVDSELFDTAQKIVRGRSPTDGNRMLAEAGDGSGAGGGGRAGGTEAEDVGEKELVKNPDGTMEFSGAGSKIKSGSVGELPDNAKSSYDSYNKSGWKGNYSGQTPGTAAGRAWDNEFEDLPTKTSSGNSITYKEFDVNSKVPGAGRDVERFLYGSDGSVYYTSDHYITFTKILGGK